MIAFKFASYLKKLLLTDTEQNIHNTDVLKMSSMSSCILWQWKQTNHTNRY